MVLNILHLEDSEKDAELIRSTLEADGFECHVSRVETRKDFERSLERNSFDLILADYKLPSFDGISAIKIAKEKSPNIPVILISGTLGEEKAAESIKQGAADYLLKLNLTHLGFAVRGALQHAEEMKKRKQAEEISSQERDFSQAVLDSLPGLFYLFDEQGKFLRWNKNFERVSGYSIEEISSLSPLDLFGEPDKGIIAEKIKQVFSTGEATAEAGFLSKGKTRTPYFFTGKLFSFEGKPSVIGMGIDIAKRKRAEEEIQKLSSAVEQIADSIVITNKDGIIEYVNPAFERLTGYTMEEVLGKTPRILKSGKQDQKYYEELWGAILAGGVFRAVVVNKKKNGELYYGEVTITPIVNANGNVTHFVSSDKNITDRKRTEEALRNAEARYRVLFEQSPNGVLLIETETGKTIEANETTYKQLGYTREEFATLRISDYEVLEKPEETAKHMQKVIREGSDDFETLHRTKSGELRNVHVWAKRLQLGERVLFYVIFQDVTERKRAEDAFKKSEEQYRQFFEDDLTGDYIATPDGKILSCNPAFARIFGFASIEEALKFDANALYPEPEEREIFLRLLKEKKRLEYFESELLRRDGTHAYCIENAVGIFDPAGNLVQIRGYIFDESKRKLLERQLVQSQKLKSLGTLASGIAHDFNNILGIIIGYATLLTRQDPNPENIKSSVDAVLKASQRGAALVKQLLTFARKGDVLLESVRLNDIVNEISKLLGETIPKTIEITLDLEKELPVITADPTQIHQVLLNLCVNARDAMPKGGRLVIATHRQQGETIRKKFLNAAESQYIRLSVADTGMGLDEATRGRIFEPFFTTKEIGKGTGLGLSVVFGIMESHNGLIDLETEPGKGTTFHLYFPVLQSLEIEHAAVESRQKIPGGTETLLVVEDEEMLGGLLRTALQTAGYTVLMAVDGQEAIDLFNEHQGDIQLVLSDMGLPKVSGYDVFRKMKSYNPNLKFILASGFMEPQIKSEIFKEGVKDFIQKPYSVYEVLRAVRAILDQK
jgi:PAS domain S-box-containing protein